MSARALVQAVGRRWRVRAWSAGVLVAIAAAAGVTAALLALDAVLALPPGARARLRWLPLAAALVPLVRARFVARRVRGTRSAALLVEEAHPSLEHVVVTLAEADLTGPLGAALRRRADRLLEAVEPGRVVPWRLGGPALAAVPALTLMLALAAASGGAGVLHARWLAVAAEARARDADPSTPEASGAAAGAPLAFASTTVEVTPPAYTGQPPRTHAGAGLVGALPGSRVEVLAEAPAGTLDARRVGGGALDIGRTSSGWSVAWTVEPLDRGVDLALRDASGAVVDRRVLALEVLEDRDPAVVLELPRTDEVVATARGTLEVRASATDDFGVGAWSLHWIRSSGSGESFSFEEGTWAWSETHSRGDTLVGTYALDLAATGLGPGDVLHLRAEAVDRNDVTGPGRGVSATRVIRVATDDELGDVTTLVGFPIEREREPLLSQRMIILLTEELLAARDSLTDAAFRQRADAIADEQDRLRDRVGEIMFLRESDGTEPLEPPAGTPAPPLEPPGHEHDGAAILEVNTELVAAYDAMWEASRLLRQADVVESLPPQRTALEHLQRLREGERVFARGRVTRPPLDLAAARGTGEVDDAEPVAREPGAAVADGARWIGEIERVVRADEPDGGVLALRLSGLAATLLAAEDGSVEAAGAVAAAADAAARGDRAGLSASLARAVASLTGGEARGTAPAVPVATDAVGAAYLTARAAALSAASGPTPGGAAASRAAASGAEPAPFVFATARYASGDWDSAPLVPSNLAHSLALYTDLPVDAEGAIVDLSSPELLRYPFVFLTGHLPLRLDEAETEGLRTYVERGGFVFIDDHNHDIDGAFHRSVRSELARIFGDDALQPLPSDHALYRSFFVFEDGPPITGHELSGWGDGLIHRELYAIEHRGRIGVLYSNKDYASEWSYHAENKRFLALDNTRFGVNVLVYALTR